MNEHTTGVPDGAQGAMATLSEPVRPNRFVPDWAPGLALSILIALSARFAARFTGPIPDVLVALFLAIAIRNLFRLTAIQEGIRFTLFYLLRLTIVLLGAGLSIQAVLKTGESTLLLVVTLVGEALLIGWFFAVSFSLRGSIGFLIGAGTAICGGSAILTLGPILGASEEEIAYAITTIFTFNVAALLAYPWIGHTLGMTQTSFGTWAGTAVNDTSVVVATGYLFGPVAGAVATVVKLIRTVLLVPLSVATGYGHALQRGDVRAGSIWRRAAAATPWFIVGFVAMAILRSAGAFSPSLLHGMAVTASFLIVIVLSGVGLNVDLAKIARLGLRPMLVGLLLAAVMAASSYALIVWLRIS